MALLLALILLACPIARAQHAVTEAAGKMEGALSGEGKIEIDGLERRYKVHYPAGYKPGTPLPVVFVFHGRTQSAAWMERVTGFNDLSDRHKFIVVYPEGIGGLWSARPEDKDRKSKGIVIDDYKFAESLIDRLVADKTADPKKVYLAGFSNGAFLANGLARKLPKKVAAIGVVAGTLPEGTEPDEKGQPVPVIYFHGTLDAIVTTGGVDIFSGKKRSFSSRELVDWWTKRNKLVPKKADPIEDKEDDGTKVTKETAVDEKGQEGLVYYEIRGGGHSWPGGGRQTFIPYGIVSREISAADEMWKFFSARQLSSP